MRRREIKINKKEKITFFIISMTILFAAYVPLVKYVSKKAMEEKIIETQISKDTNVLACLENTYKANGKIGISGWALRLESLSKRVHLLLQEVGGNDYIVLEANLCERPNIEEHFDPQCEFGDVGFYVSVDEKELKEDTCYEVYLYFTYELINKGEGEKKQNSVEEETKIALKRYIYNGDVYRYNPVSFVEPEVSDENFREAINCGELLVHDAKESVWIYEYMNRLYWIMDPSLIGTIELRTEFPISVLSTRNEYLPERYRAIGREYVGYYLDESEYKLRKGELYFLYTIPFERSYEYPVKYIHVGVYYNDGDNVGWKWDTMLENIPEELFRK